MSSPIIKAAYEHFPQPPEAVVSTYLMACDTYQAKYVAGHIALENVLAGTNNETKAVALALASEQETPLAEIYARFKSLTDPSMHPPQRSIFREIYRGYVPFGTIDYNRADDTVRKVTGSETTVAMSNHLLGISLDSGVAIADLIGTHKGAFSWEYFTNFYHLKRLLVCMRIGQSGNQGINVGQIIASLQPYRIHNQQVTDITNGLASNGHVEITKPGTSGHKHYQPQPSLIRARRTLAEAFQKMNNHQDEFIASGEEIKERVLAPRVVSYLHRRGHVRSGRGYPDRRGPLHDNMVEILKLCDGMTTDELYQLFGENYKSKTTFARTVSNIAIRQEGSKIKFLPTSGKGTKGKWVYVRPKNGANNNRT